MFVFYLFFASSPTFRKLCPFHPFEDEQPRHQSSDTRMQVTDLWSDCDAASAIKKNKEKGNDNGNGIDGHE